MTAFVDAFIEANKQSPCNECPFEKHCGDNKLACWDYYFFKNDELVEDIATRMTNISKWREAIKSEDFTHVIGGSTMADLDEKIVRAQAAHDVGVSSVDATPEKISKLKLAIGKAKAVRDTKARELKIRLASRIENVIDAISKEQKTAPDPIRRVELIGVNARRKALENISSAAFKVDVKKRALAWRLSLLNRIEMSLSRASLNADTSKLERAKGRVKRSIFRSKNGLLELSAAHEQAEELLYEMAKARNPRMEIYTECFSLRSDEK